MRMRLFALSTFGLGVGVVVAGPDMQIEFPGFLRAPRAEPSLQKFTGALGGVKAEPITSNASNRDRPFAVGQDTFTTYADAAKRTCDNQKNACKNVANGKANSEKVTLAQCDSQETECLKAASSVNPSAIHGSAATLSSTSSSTSSSSSSSSSSPAPAPKPAPAPPPPAAAVPVQPPLQKAPSSENKGTKPTPPAPVLAPRPTLHSQDDKFFYFCDP